MSPGTLLDFASCHPAGSKLPSASYVFRGLTFIERLLCALSALIICLPLLPVALVYPVFRDKKLSEAARAPDRSGASITALSVLQTRARLDAYVFMLQRFAHVH